MKLSTLSHVVHQQCPLLVYPRVPSVSLQTELLPTFNDSCGCQLFINVKECRDEDNHPTIKCDDVQSPQHGAYMARQYRQCVCGAVLRCDGWIWAVGGEYKLRSMLLSFMHCMAPTRSTPVPVATCVGAACFHTAWFASTETQPKDYQNIMPMSPRPGHPRPPKEMQETA